MSRRVIGCAIEVHKALGPGFEESAYINALKIELNKAGLMYKLAHEFDVVYAGEKVGTVMSDLYVEDRFVVDLMARPGEIGSYERSALRAQLRAADLELGLIINFAERRLKDGLVRVLNPEKLNAMRGDQEDDMEDDDEGEETDANVADFD
jgi:GxxExxY protein